MIALEALRRWWRAHYVSLKRFEPAPPIRLFQFGVLSINDPKKAAHFFIVRLPSFGIGYDISVDDYRWGQRALMYHGRQGLCITWLFKPA